MSKNSEVRRSAFIAVHDALEPLDHETRSRVVKAVTTLLKISVQVQPAHGNEDDIASDAEEAAADAVESSPTYSNFADLYSVAGPSSYPEKALVGSYWLQICESHENFSSRAVNKELTDLGYKVKNITQAFDALQKADPQLALQIKKSGSSKQARKTYRLSDAGVTKVREMING